MLHDLWRNGTLTPMIVPGIPFFAWPLFFRLRLFHTRWRWCFLFFQFLNALLCRSHLLLEHTDLCQSLLPLLFSACHTFVCCHPSSVSERSDLNSYMQTPRARQTSITGQGQKLQAVDSSPCARAAHAWREMLVIRARSHCVTFSAFPQLLYQVQHRTPATYARNTGVQIKY